MPIVSLTATSNTPRSISRAATSATVSGATVAFVRAAERRRQVAAHAQAGCRAPGRRPAGRSASDSSIALVDVLAAERLGGRREDRDLAHAGRDRALETGEVRHERGVADAGPARDAGEDLGGVRHLRHPFRADERRHLDDRQVRGAQPVDERDLVGRRHRDALVLQAVARSDFDDGDPAPAEIRERDTSRVHSSLHQRRCRPDELAFAAVDRGDRAVRQRANRQLHLHRFEQTTTRLS